MLRRGVAVLTQRQHNVLRRWLSSFSKGQPVPMPALSPTMTAGKIAKWSKKEGDKLGAGDVLCEIETDKATVDFQFQDDDMFLAKILLPAGSEDVKVGTPLALVVDSAGDVAEVQKGTYTAAAPAAAAPAPAAAAPASAASPSTAAAPASSAAASGDASALGAHEVMPSARMLLANSGLSGKGIKGSGKGGRITKADVLVATGKLPASVLQTAAAPAPAASAAAPAAAAAAPAAAAPAAFTVGRPPAVPKVAPVTTAYERPGGTWKETKPSTVRKVIATRLTESKAGIPHAYAMMDCALDELMGLRAKLKDAGINVSVNDMIIKAAAKALKDVPEANAAYDPKSDSIKANATVDVSVAVATDGGLITPIVKNADALGLVGINDKVKDLAGRARANKLKPEEFQGGSFTISNLGMFGIDEFSAVINPPQACILAVGKGEKKVVLPPITNVDDLGLPGSKTAAAPLTPKIATMMTVQLSSDARVVDPAIAGQFLQVFRHYIQNPTLLVA